MGGAKVDLGVLDASNASIEGKTGFAVRPMGSASVEDLTFDVDWDPSSVEPPAQCPGGSGDSGTFNETLVEWGLPVDHAEVALTTERPFSHPSTPNWVKRTSTCDQDTLALELHDLEDVRFKRSPTEDPCDPLTELWINTTQARNTDLRTVGFNCEDGEQVNKRVKIHPLPTRFWLKTPVPAWHSGFTGREGALFDASDSIGHFAYIKNDCLQLWEDNLEPENAATQVLGLDEVLEGGSRGAGCFVSDASRPISPDPAIRSGQFVMRGIVEAAEVGVKVTDGSKRYVDGVWDSVTSNLREAWDTDGYSEQRDRPRFTRLEGTFEDHRLEVRNTATDRGSILDVPNFPGGRIDVDLQSQWWPSGGRAPVDLNIPGSLDIPDSYLTESRCLKWNATNSSHCLGWESTREIHERIAENYLEEAGRVFEGHDEYAVPWREWADALT